MKNFIWHLKKSEKPIHIPGQNNQIIVYGETSHGVSFSICELISDGLVFSPISSITYWSNCKFTHWAYLEELIPDC